MAKPGTLTDQQELFIREYLLSRNATQAAVKAGYSEKTAASQGNRLLKKAEISTRIQQATVKILGKLEISVERVLQERARLAMYDPANAFGKDGKPLALADMDEDTRRAVQGIDVDNGVITKVRLADKDKSLTALEKHLGIYKQDGGGQAPVLNITIAPWTP